MALKFGISGSNISKSVRFLNEFWQMPEKESAQEIYIHVDTFGHVSHVNFARLLDPKPDDRYYIPQLLKRTINSRGVKA